MSQQWRQSTMIHFLANRALTPNRPTHDPYQATTGQRAGASTSTCLMDTLWGIVSQKLEFQSRSSVWGNKTSFSGPGFQILKQPGRSYHSRLPQLSGWPEKKPKGLLMMKLGGLSPILRPAGRTWKFCVRERVRRHWLL